MAVQLPSQRLGPVPPVHQGVALAWENRAPSGRAGVAAFNGLGRPGNLVTPSRRPAFTRRPRHAKMIRTPLPGKIPMPTAMTHRDRVLSALGRSGYDRIPVKHEGTPEVNQMLMSHFGLSNMEQLLRVLGDDFRYVEPVYCGPPLRTFPDGSVEGYFGERYRYAQFESGKYLEACYLPYAGVNTLDQLDRSHFPTADWFDYSTIRAQCEELRRQGFAVGCGTAGDMDFINSIARRGAWSRCSWT